MRRLLPEPATDTSVAELIEELRPWEDPPDNRPYVSVNFVVTLDGRTAIGGRSGEIGSARDLEMLVGLRTRFDAVMTGAGTMRAERYGRAVRDPEKREAREANELSADPLMVIVTGSLDLPWDAALFEDGSGEVLVFTTSEKAPPRTNTPVEVVRHEGQVDLKAALDHLRNERGIRALLCEGGPRLHARLHENESIDEVFITHAPKLVGDTGPGLADGLQPQTRQLELLWLATEPATGELFARYRVGG